MVPNVVGRIVMAITSITIRLKAATAIIKATSAMRIISKTPCWFKRIMVIGFVLNVSQLFLSPYRVGIEKGPAI